MLEHLVLNGGAILKGYGTFNRGRGLARINRFLRESFIGNSLTLAASSLFPDLAGFEQAALCSCYHSHETLPLSCLPSHGRLHHQNE